MVRFDKILGLQILYLFYHGISRIDLFHHNSFFFDNIILSKHSAK